MSKNILIIDDEEMVTDSLRKLLEKKGYAVTVARSGQDAVELNQTNDFDLIITDIRMPKLDGISSLKLIREMMDAGGRKRVPEIVLTGYAHDDYIVEAEKMKVVDCLYKPVDIWELLKSIKKAIG